jgi:heptosyltransferase II
MSASRKKFRKKLLIVMPNWLGDTVMATSFLELINNSQKAKEYSIHIAIRDSWADLFKNDSRIDDLLLYNRDGEHKGIVGNIRFAQQLRKLKFDSVILLVPSFRSAVVAFLANIPNRFGFKGDSRSLLLTDCIGRPVKGQLHYTDEFHLLMKLFDDSHVTSATLPLIDSVHSPRQQTHKYWTVAIGSTYGDAKCWPILRVAEFLDLVVGKYGHNVALVGDKNAANYIEDLQKSSSIKWTVHFSSQPSVVDYTGKTTLPQITELLNHSEIFIGNDSGLMHLSAALGCPTVGLFGSTSPAWTAPKGRRTIAVAVENFSCAPCFKKSCNQVEFCMDALPAEKVLEASNRLLGNAGEK